MSFATTIFKIVAVVGMGAIIFSFVNSRKTEIADSLKSTQLRLQDKFDSFGDSFLNSQDSRPFQTLSPEQEKGLTDFQKNIPNVFKVTSQPDPRVNASLSGIQAKESRIQRELELTTSRPELTFSTSLKGSQLSLGEQIKRDTGFDFAKFQAEKVTKDSSRFQQVLAREQSRARAISLSLFGNVQNPNFGAPSNDPRNLSKSELAEQRQNRIDNEIQRKEREARGLILQKSIGTTNLQQKENLKELGINLQGSNTLSPKALAKIQEATGFKA